MSGYRIVLVALSLVMASSVAFAQTRPAPGKRLTYEEAWKACTAFAQQVPAGDTDMSRYIRAAACMKHHGHNI